MVLFIPLPAHARPPLSSLSGDRAGRPTTGQKPKDKVRTSRKPLREDGELGGSSLAKAREHRKARDINTLAFEASSKRSKKRNKKIIQTYKMYIL
jgi:hypothetical protein